MKKTLLLTLIIIGTQYFAIAQDFKEGMVIEELNMQKYDRDTAAHAVFLNEFGNSRIDIAGDDHIRLIHDYHAKIKIFDNKGFASGTIEIPIRNNDEVSEEVTDITGTTYYKDDDGLIQRIDLDPKKVFKVKDYKYGSTVKFALPGLRKGCVIEFRYKLTSPYWDSFRKWEFQDEIPKIFSQYEVHIPGFWNFNASLRGGIKLSKTSSELERECFTSHGSKSDCSHIIYAMKDIPAFVEEDYMTSPKNFLAAIYFELIDWTNPYTGVKTVVTKEWKDIDHQLKIAEGFGSQLKRKDLMKERIATVITGKTNELDKAKAIYAYLQKWYKWNDYIGIYSPDGIKKALDAHTGSIGDINLTLVTALNAAGINTEAVVLSTREHGNVNTLYPVLNDFNYVVAKANIDGKAYLLDAADPLLSFGTLPLKCLNDKGRVISLDKPSYWIELNALQKTSSTTALDLTLLGNGKIKGTVRNYYTGYDAYLKRRAIKKFNSIDEYIEDLDEKLPKLKILKSEITNLDSLNLPLGEELEVEIDAFDNMSHSRLAFNPFLWGKRTSNPFKLTGRDYPVDWGMASDSRVVLTMHLPAQYTIETPPNVVAFSMPNNGGMFATSFDSQGNDFTFSDITRFTKAIYYPEEYPYLKELYNKIVLTEKADMVFKKKQ
jgi:putative methionine-R-sulfoxide reductase with GAF domain